MRRLLFAFVALLIAQNALAKRNPSTVIFPEQKLPIRFSHKQHLGFKLACDFCHENAPGSLASADNLTPSEDTCGSCHKIDRDQPNKVAKPAARCDSCHLGTNPTNFAAPPRVEIPAPYIKFNHKVHVDRDIACARCHGTMADVDLGTRADLPRMPLCLECHNQIVALKKKANAKCSTCHLTTVDGTLETEFPTGQLAPSGTLKGDAHTPDFATNHAQVAQQDEKYCESCHRRDFCLSCHNSVVKPLAFHGNDYVSIHAIDARKESLRCEGCHRKQTFCLGCHERSGLVDPSVIDAGNGLTKVQPPRRFHPPYNLWVNAPRTPDHHSWQAERNLKQCVSCHREETCLECHASSGAKVRGLPANQSFHVSPHPPAFAGSRQCRALAAKNGRVCLKCHAPDDGKLTCN